MAKDDRLAFVLSELAGKVTWFDEGSRDAVFDAIAKIGDAEKGATAEEAAEVEPDEEAAEADEPKAKAKAAK